MKQVRRLLNKNRGTPRGLGASYGPDSNEWGLGSEAVGARGPWGANARVFLGL
jgi:hypothetical protein